MAAWLSSLGWVERLPASAVPELVQPSLGAGARMGGSWARLVWPLRTRIWTHSSSGAGVSGRGIKVSKGWARSQVEQASACRADAPIVRHLDDVRESRVAETDAREPAVRDVEISDDFPWGNLDDADDLSVER